MNNIAIVSPSTKNIAIQEDIYHLRRKLKENGYRNITISLHMHSAPSYNILTKTNLFLFVYDYKLIRNFKEIRKSIELNKKIHLRAAEVYLRHGITSQGQNKIISILNDSLKNRLRKKPKTIKNINSQIKWEELL